MPLRSSAPIVLSALLMILSGCGFFGEEDTTIEARGSIVLTETGEPIEGLSLTLRQGGGSYGSYPVRATTQTNSDGTFLLSYDPGDVHAPLLLTINDEPYDSRYTVRRLSFVRGERRDLGVVELEMNEGS